VAAPVRQCYHRIKHFEYQERFTMRISLLAGLLAAVATIPATAQAAGNTVTGPVGGPYGVPTLPLHPPGQPAPAVQAQSVPPASVSPAAPAPAPSPQARPPMRADNGYWQGREPGNPPSPHGWSRSGNSYWGGAYRRPARGAYLPSFWLSPTYTVTNWGGYGLARPGWGQSWVRYYDDAVLVDRRGRISDSVRGLDWDRYDHGRVPEYAGDAPDDRPPGAGYGHDDGYDRDHGDRWDDRGREDDRYAGDRYAGRGYDGWGYGGDYDYDYDGDMVTWGGDRRWGGYGHRGWGGRNGSVIVSPYGSTTTIVIQSQPVVTTTTYYEEVAAPVRKWRPRAVAKPKVRYRPRPRCTCAS